MPMRRRRTEEEMLAEEEEDKVIEKASRPLTLAHMHKILTNPFYIGKIMDMDGGYIASKSHEALIDEELFYRVQQELKKKKVSMYYAEKIELPHRGFVRCANCRRVYTPYVQKGIEYFSSRCVSGCTNTKRNFNLTFLEEKIGGFISNLYFTDDEITEINSCAMTDISLLEEKRHKELEHNDRRKKKLREDLAYLRGNKLTLLKTGVFTPEALLTEENKLNIELLSLQSAEQVSDAAMHEVIKDVLKLSELIKDGSVYYSFADSPDKGKVIHAIFSELSLSGNTLTYKVKKGFQAFERRLTNFGDPTGWLSEALLNANFVKVALEELAELVTSVPP